MTVREEVFGIARRAKAAAHALAQASTEAKNCALQAMAMRVRQSHEVLARANARDIAFAQSRGLSGAMIDRLTLTPKRMEDMCASLEAVAALPDPVGRVSSRTAGPAFF